jgi:two-component system chemotaxis sensor kinase CheA
LAFLVEAARTETPVSPAETERFLVSLQSLLGEEASGTSADDDFVFEAVAFDFDAMGIDLPASDQEQGFVIRFQPKIGLYKNGHEPALLFAALAEFGSLETTLDLSELPPWEDLDPEQPFLSWSLRLTTTESETVIHEVFEFVDGLCTLDIKPVVNDVLAAAPPMAHAAVDAPKYSEALPGSPAEPQVAAPSAATAIPTSRSAPVQKDIVKTEDSGSTEARGPKPTLRVDLDRVDRLINAVGELIINQAMIAQRFQDMDQLADGEVVTHIEDYRLLARDIQEAVMAIRAQPVKPLFQRMSRIVREAADATGKSARLVTVGDGTEVDKTVIERLADPLTHMIRNAVDHGLESAEARVAAGKDPVGSILLSAAHRSGSVIITIRDDGAGLNRRKILEIAKSKGLVAPEAELNDSEIDALLFMPGFSTASTISNLSGRGVGLDVVRNAVVALGGRVSIASFPGAGTEFTISLPLTLAVMDGMVVSVAGQTMVIPITSILETIRPGPTDIHPIGTGESLLLIRGRFIPIVDVARSLNFPLRDDSNRTPLLLLVEVENQGQCALMVDSVHDQRQVVIKGLSDNYGSVVGVSAATVLGDGRVALILDPDALAANRMQSQPTLNPPLAPEGIRHAAE